MCLGLIVLGKIKWKKLNKKFKNNNNKPILMSGSIWIRNAKKC
jgi:hypothetical protein